MRQTYKNLKILSLATVISLFGLLLTSVPKALADYAYNSSDLISDSIFSNTSTMSVSAIQSFLSSENSGLTGYTDTESCNPTTPPTSSTYPYSYNYTYYPHCGQSVSAATIIYDAGHAYGVNPQAIMATMQKEQSLITTPYSSTAGYQAQINCAMGYNSCSGFVGFFNQVDNASWQLRTDIQLMDGNNWWGYGPSSYPCANSTSLYSTGLYPERSVTFANPGGTAETVTLDDSATAALYCYTPYVGPYSVTGYSGSYNFVQSFEQWWGSTVFPYAGEVTVNTYSDSGYTQQQPLSSALTSGTKVYVKVSAFNTGSQTWYPSFTRIATINPENRSSTFDDGTWLAPDRPAQLMQSSVAPGQTGTFEFSMITPNTDGMYSEDFGLVADGQTGGWMQDTSTFGFSITVSNPYNGAISQVKTYRDSGYTLPIDIGELSYGEKAYVQIKVKNIGTQTWSNTFTKAATINPEDRASVFDDSSWIASDRPVAMQESSVAPGQTGTFEFSMTAPSSSGAYNEAFGIVADGQGNGWMPAATFTFPIQVIPSPFDILEPGIVLYPGQSLQSSSGGYTLALQNDGNVVIYSSKGPIWATGTDGNSGSQLVMQGDGNLVLYSASGRVLWSTGSVGNSGSQLVMQGDGNLVLYGPSGNNIWSSGTFRNIANTPSSLASGANLTVGNELLSPNGKYILLMQGDGNLVLYNNNYVALWANNTAGTGGDSLDMQGDGNLVLYKPNAHSVWASDTNGDGQSTLDMQSDGNIVIYNANGKPTWASNTDGRT